MSESREGNATEQECQKCGKVIQQVPYKYEGKYFHARCLTCSMCGMKLAGRPFLTVRNNIFCGEQCQGSYDESHDVSVTTTAPGADREANENESFLEALKNTEERASSSSPSQTQPRAPNISSARITDYPGHTLSPSQSPGSTRRSSLSVSESSLTGSLTSEGSVGFDRNLKPQKRILKKTHGPRKHKFNRVRWNIPEEGGVADTVSLLSFESCSTTSGHTYQQARESVNESRRNWREFEEQPPAGSTGLTPSKPSLSPLRENYKYVGTMGSSPSSSLSPPPCSRNQQGDRSSSSSLSPPRSPLTQSPFRNMGMRNGTRRSSSPLQYSTDKHTGCTSTPAHNTNPRRHISSHCDANSAPSLVAPPTSVPLLKLDHSNLSDLEASTLEDRTKSHLFEIPTDGYSLQNSHVPHRPPSNKISGSPAYSGYIPPVGMAHLCGGSDADDYDHLSSNADSPLAISSANNIRFDFFPQPSKVKTKKKPRLVSPPPPTSSGDAENGTNADDLGDSDIDEALSELKNHSNSHGRSSALQSTILNPAEPETSVPPPIPPKLRRHKSASPPSTLSNGLQVGLSSVGSGRGTGNEPYPSQNYHHAPPDSVMGVVMSNLSQEDAYEDAMSSVSNATLVPESGDSSPPVVHSGHSTPKQRTKFDQFSGGQSRPPTSVHIHPEIYHPPSSSSTAPHHQSWGQWKNGGSTNFAHHPPPLPYRNEPPLSTYTHESNLPPIDENFNPEHRSVITVSNSGSDSSIRGVSPPDPISQTSVVPSQAYYTHNYLATDDTFSLSQPLPAGPLSFPAPRGQVFNTTTRVSTQTRTQGPRLRNPPTGGNLMSRNHRLYHSHRSGLTPPRQRGPGGNLIQGVGRSNRNPGGLKFQYSLDSLETPLEKLSLMPNPSYHHSNALSQDDQLMGATFYPGGLGGGRKSSARPVQRVGRQLPSSKHQPFHNAHFSQLHNGHPSHSQAHGHPSLAHTHGHKGHQSQAHSNKMTAV